MIFALVLRDRLTSGKLKLTIVHWNLLRIFKEHRENGEPEKYLTYKEVSKKIGLPLRETHHHLKYLEELKLVVKPGTRWNEVDYWDITQEGMDLLTWKLNKDK